MNENDLIRSMERTYYDIDIPGDLLSKVQDAISEAKESSADKIIFMNQRFSKSEHSHDVSEHEDTLVVKDKDISKLKTIRKNTANRHAKGAATRMSGRKYAWLSAAAALALFIILPNTNATIAHAMESVPVLGSIVKVITVREYMDDRGNVSADINVPEVQSDSVTKSSEELTGAAQTAGQSNKEWTEPGSNTGNVDSLNSEIQKYTDEIITQYEEDIKIQGKNGHEAVNSDYTVATDNDRLFSLRFDTSVAMADTNQTVKIYNVDKQTGNILALKDMFTTGTGYKTVLKNEILRQMKENSAKDDDNTYFATDDDPAMQAMVDMDDEISKANFYVNSDGNLVIVFDKGTVAPMYMGITEFTIGNDVIKDIANPDFIKKSPQIAEILYLCHAEDAIMITPKRIIAIPKTFRTVIFSLRRTLETKSVQI